MTTHNTTLLVGIFSLALACTSANAEISSLTSEELTDTYIKDTTVIIQQEQPAEQPETEPVPVTLTVTPLEKGAQVLPQDPTHSVSSISNELDTYTDLNNQAAIDQALLQPAPDSTTRFLRPALDEAMLNTIKDAYGIDRGEQIDLTTLKFNDNIPLDNLTAASDLQITPIIEDNSFTIRIPNTGNFNTQQISSPNGEVSVNVNSQFIEYTLNIPQ